MASHNGKYYVKKLKTKDIRNVKTLHSFGFVKQPPALSNSTGQDENNNEILSDSEKRSDRLPEQRSGHSAVVSMLVLQAWGRWFDPPLLQSFG